MYNEQESIPLLRADLSQAPDVGVIVAVDDGSADRTLELLLEWSLDEPRLRIVSYHPNRGLPGALLAGFREAVELGAGMGSGAGSGMEPATGGVAAPGVIVTMDADGSHPFSLIRDMAQKIAEGYDIVIASRHAPGAAQFGLAWYRKVFSWGASLLMRLAYPLRGVRDYSTNYRAYRGSLLLEALTRGPGQFIEAGDFSGVVELLLRLCSLGPRVTEVPLELHYERKRSASKAKVMRMIAGYLKLASHRKTRSVTGVCLPLLPTGSPETRPPGSGRFRQLW